MADPLLPLIVVVGATGTGKSKLAVELASKFDGEIINADAVQMYKGLPIVTNKIPEDEINGIKHHLLDQIDLEEPPWTVLQFLEASLKIIEQIRARGRLPIIVGGTNYYIYSLLFEEATVGTARSEASDVIDVQYDLSILEESNEVIYAKLMEVDPDIARRWHPNDRRKIQRSLEIWLSTGRKASEIYAEQKMPKDDVQTEVWRTMRHDPLIFWIEPEFEVLKERLNSRVDVMIQNGLLEEVKLMRQFERQMLAENRILDKSRGIWVAIGYKELGQWLDLCDANSDQLEIDKARLDGIESVKSGTRQYAKRQNNWVRIKFAQSLQRAASLDRLMLLDGTDVFKWDEHVALPSQAATKAFLEGQYQNTALQSLAGRAYEKVRKELTRPQQETQFCETCQQTTMTSEEWQRHIKSKGHKRALQRIKKRADRDAYFARIAKEAKDDNNTYTSSARESSLDAPNNTTS